MKNILRLAALLIVAAFVFTLTSCEYTFDVAERVASYLEKEYPGKSFDIINYEKRNETSGRYEINVRCRDDGTNFRMYMYSSIATTDAYSVERANNAMKDIITEEIGTELSENFKNIQWYDIYADRATNYRFREIELKESFALSDLKSIYEVQLKDNLGEAEIGAVIYNFVYELCNDFSDNCSFDSAVFIYKIGRTTYTFTTNSKSILNLGKDGVVHYVLTNISDSNKKNIELEYFSEGTVEEGTENEGAENEGTQNNDQT